jgi:hypothetical protein
VIFQKGGYWLKAQPENPFLGEGLVDHATMIIGQPMAGKSMLSTSLALALSNGDDEWLGRKVNGGPYQVAFGVTDPRAEGEAARRLKPHADDFLIGSVFDNHDDYWKTLADELVSADVDVFILDNVMGSIRGEVNSASDARRFTDGLRYISAAGINLVVIHHAAKPGPGGEAKTPMGSQHFKAWCRTLLHLGGTGDRRTLTVLSNNAEGESIKLDYRDCRFSLRGAADDAQEPKRDRGAERLDRDRALVAEVASGGLAGGKPADVGRWLMERGWDFPTPKAASTAYRRALANVS